MEEKRFVITEENAKDYVIKIGNWIKDYLKESHADGVVLGMSSGVDCSTVATLCKVNNINTRLILMPYGEDMEKTKSYQDSMELINKFNFEYQIFDIKPAVDSLQIKNTDQVDSSRVALSNANIRPRVRMTYLYQYGQLNNLLVIGTGNLSERTVGYFTKWGDGASDLNPIGMLTKKEVYILAKYLGVPSCIINKKPSAGLWEGQTDEAELGLKYEQIDEYILNGTCGDKETDKIIKAKNEIAMHKLKPINIFNN